MGEYRYRENVKRGMAFVLAIILGGMAFLPGFPVFPAKAAPASGQQTTLTTATSFIVSIRAVMRSGELQKKGISMKHTVPPRHPFR